MSWYQNNFPATRDETPLGGADFDAAVRRSVFNMGRLDLTYKSIPWNAVDVPMVTELPRVANEGAEVNYVASETAGIVWKFVYRQSTAQWHFVGGPPLRNEKTDTGDVFTSATFADGSPAGPSIIVPFKGTYRIHWGARMAHDTAGGFGVMAIKNGSAAISDLDGLLFQTAAGFNDQHTMTKNMTAATANTTFKAQYRNGSGVGNLTLHPISPTTAPPFLEVLPILVTG